MASGQILIDTLITGIKDTTSQISRNLISIKEVKADLTAVVSNYTRNADAVQAPINRDDKSRLVVPTLFERHENSRRSWLVTAYGVLVIAFLYSVFAYYYGVSQDPYELFWAGLLALVGVIFWHTIFHKLFSESGNLKLRHEYEHREPTQKRVRFAKLVALILISLAFASGVYFTIGRFSGDDTGWINDYFLYSIFLTDILALTGSSLAHAISDYYGWSRKQVKQHRKESRKYSELLQETSRLIAKLHDELQQLNGLDANARQAIQLPDEVKEELEKYDQSINQQNAKAQTVPHKAANNGNSTGSTATVAATNVAGGNTTP